MQGPVIETVGENFREDLLIQARDLSLRVLEATAAEIRPGISESDAKIKLAEIQARMGAPGHWHPPQIRFGEHTLLPFGKPGKQDLILQDDDIFFLDIGPVFQDHEGDIGRTFTVGDDPLKKKCVRDAAEIWFEVRAHWRESNVTGPKLYAFATACAEKRGWLLSLRKANGHRIADYPHAAQGRGSIEGHDKILDSNRWILEVQIRHPELPFGAFYEDLLN